MTDSRKGGRRTAGGAAGSSAPGAGPRKARPAAPAASGARKAGSAASREGGPRGRVASAPGAGSRTVSGKTPAEAIHRLTELEQIKVLADPLRIRILELLGEERTTKQVAGILGQPPTRLYHHVAALERVGLIRLARTRQSRGALEKYYVAVAKAFSADPRLFSSPAARQAAEATQGVALQLLENTAADMRALIESGKSPKALAEGGVLSFLEVRGSDKELRALRAKLMKLLKDCTAGKVKAADSGPGYRLTIAYFPLAGRLRSS